MKKMIIAALTGATLLSGTAIAASQTTPSFPPVQKHARFDPLLLADSNKDGIVTRAETLASVEARFGKLDTNKDGTISAEESRAARSAMFEKARERRAAMGKATAERAKRPERTEARANAKPRAERPPVTITAETERALKRFALADRNNDGSIDQAERETLRQIVREFGGKRAPGKWGPHARHGGKHMKSPPAPVAPVKAN